MTLEDFNISLSYRQNKHRKKIDKYIVMAL